MRVLVYTSTRADYGILRSLLGGMEDHRSLKPSLLVTGSHLSAQHGMTVDAIEKDGFEIAERVPIPVESDHWTATIQSLAAGMAGYGPALQRVDPDAVVILGDRFEAFAFAAVCHVAQVPIIHLHGGEVTAGAIDDAFRHSITKFATLHLVANEEFRKRVIQLGEEPEMVSNVGALGLDTIRAELGGYQGTRENRALVTYHPSTIGSEDSMVTLRAILDGALRSDLESITVTRPNIDAGASEINHLLDSYEDDPRIELHDALGSKLYVRALARSRVVVGNSSSGIIEAPFLGTPTINVGLRQSGRPQEQTVIDIRNPSADLVMRAIEDANALVREPFMDTIYGDGRSTERCVAQIASLGLPGSLKRFRDIEFS